MKVQQLRLARPTDNLEAVLRFYRNGLGLELVASFADHAGFDGVMLALPGAAYHTEDACTQHSFPISVTCTRGATLSVAAR
jgi:catechol 2,3-dioxygenase-like lactoylglutathione lyase family enzyme